MQTSPDIINKPDVAETGTPARFDNQNPDALAGVLQEGATVDGPGVHTLGRRQGRLADATTQTSPVMEKAESLQDSTAVSARASNFSQQVQVVDLAENCRLRQRFKLQLQWLRDKEDEEQRRGDVSRAKEYSQSAQRVQLVLERLRREVFSMHFFYDAALYY